MACEISAASATSFVPPQRSLPHPDPHEEPQRIRVALIGTGKRARTQLAPVIFQNPKFHLRAVWSRSQASAKRFNLEVAGRSLEAFHGDSGLQSLLERSDIEGFVVALPAVVQASYVERILKHRRHVLSESPAALERGVGGELLKHFEDASKESRCVWFVANSLRYEPVLHPSSLKLDSIGPVFAGELYAVLVVDPAKALDGPPRTVESLFMESGVQHIAVLQQLLGNITEVNCIQVSKAPGQDENKSPASISAFWDDALSGVLRFEGGAACAVNWQTSANEEDRRFRLSLLGPRGSITVEQEAGSQAASAGIVRYAVKRCPAPDRGDSVASLSAGAERQLEAWGEAIGKASSGDTGGDEDPAAARSAPGHAIVDVCVLSAMLQSCGNRVQITRTS